MRGRLLEMNGLVSSAVRSFVRSFEPARLIKTKLDGVRQIGRRVVTILAGRFTQACNPITFDPVFSTHDKNIVDRWKRGEDEIKRPDRPNAYPLIQCILHITAGDKHITDVKTKPTSLPDINRPND